MSAAIAALYRAAAAAVRVFEAVKREFRGVWIAARTPTDRQLTKVCARLEVAADAAEHALDTVIDLALPQGDECADEVRIVRQGLRWGDVLELHAQALALDAMADDFDRAALAPALVTAAE